MWLIGETGKGRNDHCFKIREEVDKLLIRLMPVFLEDVRRRLYHESDQTQTMSF